MFVEGASVVQANRLLREASKESLGGRATRSPVVAALVLNGVEVNEASHHLAKVLVGNDTFGLRAHRERDGRPSIAYVDHRSPLERRSEGVTREEMGEGGWLADGGGLWSDELYSAAVAPIKGEDSVVAMIRADHLLLDDGSKQLLRSQLTRSLGGGSIEAHSYQVAVRREEEYLTSGAGEAAFEQWKVALDGILPFPDLDGLDGSAGSTSTLYASVEVPWDAIASRTMPTTAELFHALALSLRAVDVQRPVIHISASNRLDPYNRECVGWFAHSLPVPVASDLREAATSAKQLFSAVRRQRVPLPYLTHRLQPECFGRHARMPRVRLSAWPNRARSVGQERVMLLDDVDVTEDVLTELPESYSDVSFDAIPTTRALVLVARGPESVIGQAILEEALTAWSRHVSARRTDLPIETRRSS